MKYHYQFVSKTTVRIELIPEDKKDITLIERLTVGQEDDEELQHLFNKGLETYSAGTVLTKTKFMNFPKVALCNYTNVALEINAVI